MRRRLCHAYIYEAGSREDEDVDQVQLVTEMLREKIRPICDTWITERESARAIMPFCALHEEMRMACAALERHEKSGSGKAGRSEMLRGGAPRPH